jgi:tetratricopeptide (TPR) repeat protein
MLLISTGRATEGVIHAERAVELDPVSRIMSRVLGTALWTTGRIEETIEQFRKTTELAPGWATGWLNLSEALLEFRGYEEGLEAWVEGMRLSNSNFQAATDAYQAAMRYGETGEPQTFSEFNTSLFHRLWLYNQTGQLDRASELFEDLFRQGAPGRVAQASVLYTSNLGDDPRYQALLEQAGITW